MKTSIEELNKLEQLKDVNILNKKLRKQDQCKKEKIEHIIEKMRPMTINLDTRIKQSQIQFLQVNNNCFAQIFSDVEKN